MGIVGYVLLGLLALVVLMLLAAVLNAVRIKARPAKGKAAISWAERDVALDAERLSRMIQIQTLSKNPGEDMAEFRKLQDLMRELFPRVFETCTYTDFDGSLLIRWKGRDSSRSVVLMGHQDVVPATEPDWKFPPFSGALDGGRVYGRGAMDCKCTLMTELAAMEELIEEGFTPAVDIYLASSANEEISGGGATATAQHFKQQRIRPEVVLDEGGVVTTKFFPGLTGQCAVIGVTEKGFINLKVTAKSHGGHSSTPPRHNPLARLAAFIDDMERARPFKKGYSPAVKRMFASLAPSLSFPMRLLFGNLWLFGPLLKALLPAASPFGEAMLATTFCFTMCEGSPAPNVIPAEAYALCNLRCIAHEDMEATVALFKKRAEKYDLGVEVVTGRNSSKLVDMDGKAFSYLTRCIEECIPGVTVSPYMMMGGTDCREFEIVSDGCLRFSPIRLSPEQLASAHSVNENVDAAALAEAHKFYRYFIENYQ
ncbi:MAG TPA: M20/M25/M40 family metallo-hydrolase [Clostridia bacterium]|nr:M20/M25/M40 family metallo-hydrolase [Clostridia bacterium]